ncbi:copper/zinc superoxide dismutase (SODC) domain-containing protein [Ditylenchus destructor]|nr:copper/zinc superoxide dismutase (SODC) domain-containing protein [Ditylenchus destructor]
MILCATLFLLLSLLHSSTALVTHAKALLYGATNETDRGLQKYLGAIEFYQSDEHVVVNGTIAGLTPGDHGFHIHVFGAYGKACTEAGPHFNPDKVNHGGPNDTERHVGDLGNIHAGGDGSVQIDIKDSKVSLNGRNSAVGRSVVVHAKPDDLGKGGASDSKSTGAAGARLACGIIGIVEENDERNAALTSFASSLPIFVSTLSTLVPVLFSYYAL